MGTEPDGIDLVLSLVLQPGLNHILGEHIASQQKVMILLQGVQRLIQRPRHRFHLGRLFGLQLIQVPVDRFGRLDLVSDRVNINLISGAGSDLIQSSPVPLTAIVTELNARLNYTLFGMAVP